MYSQGSQTLQEAATLTPPYAEKTKVNLLYEWAAMPQMANPLPPVVSSLRVSGSHR